MKKHRRKPGYTNWKWSPLVTHEWTDAESRCKQQLSAPLIQYPEDVEAELQLCTLLVTVESLHLHSAHIPLTHTHSGRLLAARHPQCLTCSPCSALPNEFIIIQSSREMQSKDREKTE